VSRFFLRLIPVLTIPFLLLSLVARALGSTQPPNPALEGFTTGCEDKPQPCWYGIVPGVTTVEDASNHLLAIGYVDQYDAQKVTGSSKYCDVFHQYWLKDHTIIGINLQDCPSITLGLIIDLLNAPDFVTPGGDGEIILTFKNSIRVIVRSEQDWLSPYNQSIWFISIGWSVQPPPSMSYQWHGFASYHHYKQLEPLIGGKWFWGG
jgi:hypothetical protein